MRWPRERCRVRHTPATSLYDLIVVGAGISGLAAAEFWREARPGARILLLDNHDDFGGHARRNEYRMGDRTLLMNGGTMLIDSPRPYSAVAAGLLARLGVQPARLRARHADAGFWTRQGMGRGVFLDRESFGGDFLATGIGRRPWAEALRDAPLAARVRDDIVRLHEAKIDYLPGKTSAEKKALLARTSYRDYLGRIAGVDPAALPFFQAMSHGEWASAPMRSARWMSGPSISRASRGWAWRPARRRGWATPPPAMPRAGRRASTSRTAMPRSPGCWCGAWCPARSPGAAPRMWSWRGPITAGWTGPARRCASGWRAPCCGCGTPAPVASRWSTGAAVRRDGSRAANCILACWGMMIPFLCPELPEAQAAALRSQVKVPLVYASVLLRDWQAFRRLGIARVQAPGSFFSSLRLDWKTRIGGYDSVRGPGEPVLLFLSRVPCAPGLDQRAQHRAGRAGAAGDALRDLRAGAAWPAPADARRRRFRRRRATSSGSR